MPISFPYKFSDWYGYDKDCSSRSSAYRYDGNPGRPISACSTSRAITTQFWHNGSSALPGNGDTCYTSATGNNYLANGNWAIRPTSGTNTPTNVITISGGAGVISATQFCIT